MFLGPIRDPNAFENSPIQINHISQRNERIAKVYLLLTTYVVKDRQGSEFGSWFRMKILCRHGNLDRVQNLKILRRTRFRIWDEV